MYDIVRKKDLNPTVSLMEIKAPLVAKKCRVKEVLNLSDKFEEEFYKSKISNTYSGIIETRKDGTKVVITTNYIPVVVETTRKNNEIVNVTITHVDTLVHGKID